MICTQGRGSINTHFMSQHVVKLIVNRSQEEYLANIELELAKNERKKRFYL